MKTLIAQSFLILLSVYGIAARAEPSHCKRGETVFFSCPVKGGKIVSLCGRSDEWLQYRFGKLGAIELAYPQQQSASLDAFKATHVLTHMGAVEVDSLTLAFVSGGIGYQVESTIPQSQKLVQGVSIADPRSFDLPLAGKPRTSYPKAFVSCTGKADTGNFYGLVESLRD